MPGYVLDAAVRLPATATEPVRHITIGQWLQRRHTGEYPLIAAAVALIEQELTQHTLGLSDDEFANYDGELVTIEDHMDELTGEHMDMLVGNRFFVESSHVQQRERS